MNTYENRWLLFWIVIMFIAISLMLSGCDPLPQGKKLEPQPYIGYVTYKDCIPAHYNSGVDITYVNDMPIVTPTSDYVRARYFVYIDIADRNYKVETNVGLYDAAKVGSVAQGTQSTGFFGPKIIINRVGVDAKLEK